MPTHSLVLTDHQTALVTRLVDSGRYQNASEVIREGLRLIERQETEDDVRLKVMRETVDVADIGTGRFYDFGTTESLHDHLSAVVNETLADRRPPADSNR